MPLTADGFLAMARRNPINVAYPRQALPDLFRAKAASDRARWPWLRVIDPVAPPA